MFDSEFERNLFELRKTKLVEIEKLGQAAYPNQFPASHTIPQVRAKWGEAQAEELEANRVTVAVAGRIMAIRAQGKAGFATLQQEGAAAADLRPPRRGGRAGIRALQAARPGRPHRRVRLPVPHADRRADDPRGAADVSRQGHAGAAGEVSRAGRRGAALPPALCGPVCESRQPRSVCEARQNAEGDAAASSTSAAIWKWKRR